MKPCYRCGDQLDDDATFCIACGAANTEKTDQKRAAIESELERRKGIRELMSNLFNVACWLRILRH